MNPQAFFDEIRISLFGGKLSVEQIDIIEAILKECSAQQITDNRQIAYILATTYHECYNWNLGYAGRMIQLLEMGGYSYLRKQNYYPFYGRGPSHLTWKRNYEMEGKRLGLDLVKNPDLMLDIKIGAESHVYCMKHGSYTGKKLSDFINDRDCDFESARQIINPKDFKTFETVAEYANKFLNALK